MVELEKPYTLIIGHVPSARYWERAEAVRAWENDACPECYERWTSRAASSKFSDCCRIEDDYSTVFPG